MLFTVIVLPGCGNARVTMPKALDDLSLVKIWNMVLDATGVQNESVELESFRLMVNENSKIDDITFIFHENDPAGKSKTYSVEINATGKLEQHPLTGLFPATSNPLDIFTQLDKIRLSSLQQENTGLWLQADFQNGPISYDNEHLNLFQLDNGNLLPLKIVTFSGVNYCILSLYQLTNNTAGTATTVGRDEKTLTQIWFLTEDINRAETVVY